MAVIIADRADVAGVPTDGCVINAYRASRFSTPPALGTPAPGAADVGPISSGPSNGQTGGVRITVPTNEDYYCSYQAPGSTTLAWGGPYHTGTTVPKITGYDAYRPGRQWATQFDNATADSTWLTLVNMTYTTDSTVPCIKQTATGSLSTAFLSGNPQIEDVDITIRYRLRSDATYLLANTWVGAVARCLPAPAVITSPGDGLDNSVFGIDNKWHPGLGIASYKATANGIPSAQQGTAPVLDNTDVTTHRYLRFQATGNTLRVKNWKVGTLEPAWNTIGRSRSASPGEAGVTLTLDDIQAGTAGLFMLFTGAYVFELKITELIPATTNIVHNPTFSEVATAATVPAAWYFVLPADTGQTLDTPSLPDWKGVTRPVARIISASPGVGTKSFWRQQIYNTSCGGGAYVGRVRPYPRGRFGPVMEMRVWTKGTSVVNPSPSNVNLGAAFVGYYYDQSGNPLNQNASAPPGAYFTALGPNIDTSSGYLEGGTGTWDWYQTVFRFAMYSPDSAVYLDFAFGLHDSGTTGTLLIADPELRQIE